MATHPEGWVVLGWWLSAVSEVLGRCGADAKLQWCAYKRLQHDECNSATGLHVSSFGCKVAAATHGNRDLWRCTRRGSGVLDSDAFVGMAMVVALGTHSGLQSCSVGWRAVCIQWVDQHTWRCNATSGHRWPKGGRDGSHLMHHTQLHKSKPCRCTKPCHECAAADIPPCAALVHASLHPWEWQPCRRP